MTSEVVIMNKEAIALAADSAVTMEIGEDRKIKTSANKLFALSKYHPVGLMVYGDAVFMGVPWETIIKIYRNKLSKEKFDTLEGYAENFIEFLDKDNPLFLDSVQKWYVQGFVFFMFEAIKEDIEEEVKSNIPEQGTITENEIEKIIQRNISKHYEIWQKTDNIPSLPDSFNKSIPVKYKKIIDKALKEIFGKLPLSRGDKIKLKKIAESLFSKYPEDIPGDLFSVSGIVIAGFGEEDPFPTQISYDIDGVANNRLKYKADEPIKIGVETVNSHISAFAQRKMVYQFMEGIDPDLHDYMAGYLSELFDKYPEIILNKIGKNVKKNKTLIEQLKQASNDLFEEYQEKFRTFRNEIYSDPIMEMVTYLSKSELAEMAESLVYLTSFKQKVTMESETVGGPIDVAVISKGEGFIWIKRKHYFEAELNPQFLAKYYM